LRGDGHVRGVFARRMFGRSTSARNSNHVPMKLNK
jgi:hypothetical protein